MRKGFLIIFSFFYLFAGSGKYGSERFEFGYSARVQGKGCAFIAGEDDITATFLNPAILSSINSLKIEASYSTYYGGILSSGSFNLCLPNKENTFGISLFFIQVPKIPHTYSLDPDSVDNFDDIILKGYFNSYTYCFNFNFSKKIRNFDFGLNTKLFYEDILNENGKGVGFDIGILKKINENTKFGVSILNLFGTYFIWTTGKKEVFNPLLNTGFSFNLFKNLLINFDFSIKTENIKNSSFFNISFLSLHPRLGFEWNLFKFLNLRGGLEESFPCFGFGFIFKGLLLDYALRYSFDLGDSHIVTLSYKR
ncbi:MAG: hypothetical protein ABIM36_02345 [candidate division WOR-3 bacterium]